MSKKKKQNITIKLISFQLRIKTNTNFDIAVTI